MSEPVNVFEIETEADDGQPAGYRNRTRPLRELLGASVLGATVWELDPGQSTCPYHYENVEEEWVYVLIGTPILRDPDGEHELAPGDLVCFPPAPEGGHKLTNRSDSTVRILMLSTQPEVSICVYPDSDKVGVWPPGGRYRMSDKLGYWDGEI